MLYSIQSVVVLTRYNENINTRITASSGTASGMRFLTSHSIFIIEYGDKSMFWSEFCQNILLNVHCTEIRFWIRSEIMK